MTSIWDYSASIARSDRNLVGYDVEATDGHIGKIDEASNEAGRSHLVVDTGFWIFGKKRLIPAGVVRSIDDDYQKVHISLTKDEVKSAPDFDEQRRDYSDYRDEYDTYYTRFGSQQRTSF
jgi:hypothetical protein